MDDLYNVLGVDEGVSDADLKIAYRKLVRELHPDAGGNEEEFKRVSNAYDILKDPNKKAEYHAQKDFAKYQNQRGFHRSGPIPNDIEDILRDIMGGSPFRRGSFNEPHFGPGFAGNNRQYQSTPQNRDIKIKLSLNLEDIYKPLKKTLSVTLMSGRRETIEVDIPAGVKNNTFIKYNGLGDNSITTERRGDLYVNIEVMPHPIFERVNNHLVIHKTINCIDAMLGTKIDIITLDKRVLSVIINKGTQNGTVLRLEGEGMPISDNFGRPSQSGNMQIVINVSIPTTLTKEQIKLLKKIKG